MPEPPYPVLWGFPCGKQVYVPWLKLLCQFHDASKHPTSMPLIADHPGRVDMARSYMIQTLKDNPLYKWLHSYDTDVIPNSGVGENKTQVTGISGIPLTLDRLCDFLDEDAALGFDVVVGATLSRGNLSPMVWTDIDIWAEVTEDNPFRINSFAGGFFAMTKRCAQHLKVVAEMPTPSGAVKLYCTNTEKGGEDITLSENIRASGFKIACDPRILVGHREDFYQFPDSARTWATMRDAARKALQGRAERVADG